MEERGEGEKLNWCVLSSTPRNETRGGDLKIRLSD